MRETLGAPLTLRAVCSQCVISCLCRTPRWHRSAERNSPRSLELAFHSTRALISASQNLRCWEIYTNTYSAVAFHVASTVNAQCECTISIGRALAAESVCDSRASPLQYLVNFIEGIQFFAPSARKARRRRSRVNDFCDIKCSS